MTGFQDVPLEKIVASRTNPRKEFDAAKLKELAEDIALRGVLQPVLLRPSPLLPSNFELVFGERRWRAAQKAKLGTIPAIVRELSDQQVLEIQLVENDKRADLHPLEQADGYRQLHEVHGLSIEKIAQRVGRSVTTIRDALAVGRLGAKARKDWLSGELGAGVARRLARIPAGKAQDECLTALQSSWHGDAMMDVELADRIIERFMRELSKAPFNIKQPHLACLGAGACSSCEKRSGAQPQLFSDVKQRDVCLDVECYEKKVKAWWQDRMDLSRGGKGPRCLSVVEAKEICDTQSGLMSDAPYVSAEQSHPSDMKGRSYKVLLGKEAKSLETLVLHPRTGKVMTVYPKELLAGALKRAGKLDAMASQRSDGRKVSKKEAEEARMERLEKKVRDKVQKAVIELAAAETEKRKPEGSLLALLARLAGEAAPWSVHARRRVSDSSGWESVIEKMKPGQRLGLVLEVLLEHACLHGGRDEYPVVLRLAADELDINLKALEDAVRDAENGHPGPLSPATPASKTPASKKFPKGSGITEKCTECGREFGEHAGQKCPKTKASKKPEKGVCRKCGCTDAHGCPEGCAWTDDTETLCTSCAPTGDEELDVELQADDDDPL